MSNKNYNKMYKPANPEASQEEIDVVVTEEVTTAVETPVEPEVTEVVEAAEVAEVENAEPVKPVETVSAVVVNCAKLNVREEPVLKAKVVAVIDASSEVVVYATEGFGNYYKVCTASGIEGYCVKDFLELK